MNTPFFITGLPQSRTAWLANLFTGGPVFCHHDLLGSVANMAEFRQRLTMEGVRQVGDSDSGLLAVYPQVCQMFPGCKWVLVKRDFDDAWNSLVAFVGSGPWRDKLSCTWELHETMRKQWEQVTAVMIQSPRMLTVPYRSLDHSTMIEQIWKHCAPGLRFDQRRADHLQTLSVRPFQEKTPIRPQLSLIGELYGHEGTKTLSRAGEKVGEGAGV